MLKLRRMLDSRVTLALGAWVVYALAFIPLYRMLGPMVLMTATVPVMIWGWFFGMWVGLLAGLLAFPLHVLLTTLAREAIWEVMIGLGFLVGLFTNKLQRLTILLLFLQMPGTALPLLILPEVVWTSFPFVLTLEGQYIFKTSKDVVKIDLIKFKKFSESRGRDRGDRSGRGGNLYLRKGIREDVIRKGNLCVPFRRVVDQVKNLALRCIRAEARNDFCALLSVPVRSPGRVNWLSFT